MFHSKKNQFILSIFFIITLSYFLYNAFHPLVHETGAAAIRVHPLITCKEVSESFQPAESTAIFYIDSPAIHSLLRFENLPKQSVLTAKWFYHSQNQKLLYETSVDVSGSDTAHFWIQAPAKGWYIGSYMIEIYLNENLIEKKEIIVTYK
ncbi:hypothetical protein SAMN02745975_01802 [Geosporobacter subterraneus DSM 17957]|uniref:Uncharacterized protein n=1 Tax=Geosporobacter subterraneus DSM 17957 TaxID=1121919 RepID=A0A1M6IBQ0_9FIRM|nr:hypothetical protein [Geosporobacter subterraneus]SHJ31840.1 hypothetical protein SAMN02745975_01802 [Geosporobacter subterraneus DSM 17957]